MSATAAQDLLRRVLDSDRAFRDARDQFLRAAEHDRAQLQTALGERVSHALRQPEDLEAGAELMCIADLLADVGGPEAARALLRVLGHEEPAVRAAAGDALLELLYERYGEVARVIESEVDRGAAASPLALAEIPYILAEAGESGGVRIVVRLLDHKDPEVVGAAIEGLAALGDPSVVRRLEALRNDPREVAMEDESGEGEAAVTLGDLAEEAIQHLKPGRG